MGNIIIIKEKDIEEVLKGVSRQYLVGNLKLPQELKFISDYTLSETQYDG